MDNQRIASELLDMAERLAAREYEGLEHVIEGRLWELRKETNDVSRVISRALTKAERYETLADVSKEFGRIDDLFVKIEKILNKA